MRISDWSSDVCSSDLDNVARQAQGHRFRPILLLHRSKLNRVAIAGHQELSVQARVSRARPATSRLGFLTVPGVMDWQYGAAPMGFPPVESGDTESPVQRRFLATTSERAPDRV